MKEISYYQTVICLTYTEMLLCVQHCFSVWHILYPSISHTGLQANKYATCYCIFKSTAYKFFNLTILILEGTNNLRPAVWLTLIKNLFVCESFILLLYKEDLMTLWNTDTNCSYKG